MNILIQRIEHSKESLCYTLLNSLFIPPSNIIKNNFSIYYFVSDIVYISLCLVIKTVSFR